MEWKFAMKIRKKTVEKQKRPPGFPEDL